MVRFFVKIEFYSFAIFLSNQLWILIFLNEMSTRPSVGCTACTIFQAAFHNHFFKLLTGISQIQTPLSLIPFNPRKNR
ncbi:Uncharacterised protein [Kingella negevensis]|uniref:Uncharacterized protein n=1 Tax=Kingella negevensis TaxID=1522312 RepID=A0A238TAN5_9NEIS|nr:Uncharacterised protein [Kingella negevensis]